MKTDEHDGLGAGDAAGVGAFESALRKYCAGLTANFETLTDAQEEDQLKAPVGELVMAAGKVAGLKIGYRTEVRVEGVAGRPDLGVSSDKLPVGNIELKAPGKGADPEKFRDKHSRGQFERFKRLPNLIYTDGRSWALFRDGLPVGLPIKLSMDPTADGADAVTAGDASKLLGLLGQFLRWEPVVPSSPHALALMLAPLTRILRDEVLVDVKEEGVMAVLADEWRQTLFPDANDEEFADGYAQTFAYALLLARLGGAAPPLDADSAAKVLDADHALLAQVLRVLGQGGTRDAIGMPVGLLERVIGGVKPEKLAAGPDPWLYFYEDFLGAYTPAQRNNRGVYYTPVPVVSCQVRLCDRVLSERLDKPGGFGEPDVLVLDPAVGTGTYPVTVVAQTLEKAVSFAGPGVAAQVATQLVANLHAFELLVGPYAVSHLRLSQTLADRGADMPEMGVKVLLTDALAAPAHEGSVQHPTLFEKRLIAEQEAASRVKSATTEIRVVIGNPPYDREEAPDAAKNVRRKGGMVRYGQNGGPGLIEDFLAPARAAGKGIHVKNLYNTYVYFWR